MTITNGDADALVEFTFSKGLFEGTSRPVIKVPPI
jgi:hypothetical protein